MDEIGERVDYDDFSPVILVDGKLMTAHEVTPPQRGTCPACGANEYTRRTPKGRVAICLCPGEWHRYPYCRTPRDRQQRLYNLVRSSLQKILANAMRVPAQMHRSDLRQDNLHGEHPQEYLPIEYQMDEEGHPEDAEVRTLSTLCRTGICEFLPETTIWKKTVCEFILKPLWLKSALESGRKICVGDALILITHYQIFENKNSLLAVMAITDNNLTYAAKVFVNFGNRRLFEDFANRYTIWEQDDCGTIHRVSNGHTILFGGKAEVVPCSSRERCNIRKRTGNCTRCLGQRRMAVISPRQIVDYTVEMEQL